MRRLLRSTARAVAAIVLLLFAAIAALLLEAHHEMCGIKPPLPTRDAVSQALAGADGPVRVSSINTATQRGPQATMGFPAFLLEWSDGRGFLIDTGMERDAAIAFGKPIELLLGSEPIEPHGSLREQIGEAAHAIDGVGFTHLHSDHTGGLAGLCDGRDRVLPVFQTPWQAERQNFGTAPGHADIEDAACTRRSRLAGGPIYPVPGFPGLVAVAAGGHTPGSTLFFARVADVIWVFAGDITNVMESLRRNRPKSRIYSGFIVPESRGRLEQLRLWLGELDRASNFAVIVSHDPEAAASSGMPDWQPPR